MTDLAGPVVAAARVRAVAPRLGTVRLAVVDGPAGSGKTTYAAALAGALGGAPVVHMDDLYRGWTGLDDDVYARLAAQVLEPLQRGEAARYQVYDWAAGRFDRWVPLAVPGPEVSGAVVLEGVGSAARPVDHAAVLRVWVEAPYDVRIARGIARDGEALREQWLRWAEREAAHFAADGTPDRADLVVHTA